MVGFLGAQKELGQSLSPGCRAGGWCWRDWPIGGIFLSFFKWEKNIFHVMYSDHTFPFSPKRSYLLSNFFSLNYSSASLFE